jgi:subtilisin family serine protease
VKTSRSPVVLAAVVIAAQVILFPSTSAGGRPLSTLRPPALRRQSWPRSPRLFEPYEVLVRFELSASHRARSGAIASIRATSAPVRGTGLMKLRLPEGASVREVVRELRSQPGVAVAEPDYLYALDASPPNDPDLSQEWGLADSGQSHDIADAPFTPTTGLTGADANVLPAWDTTTGDPSVVIAVIDSGVDLTHPDLMPNIWVNTAEMAGTTGVDDDGNGFIDDVNGWDFVAGDNQPIPGHPHGTHVAGIIAAAANDGVGMAGVCPRCTIMPLRVADDTGTVDDAAVIQAIHYAVRNGASIMNMSFGGQAWSPLMRAAIKQAGASGVLAVVAAGNSASDNDSLFIDGAGHLHSPSYPASFDLPTIISVAASTDHDRYGFATGCAMSFGASTCLFTNRGHDSVDLAAPGVDIYSAYPGGTYVMDDGTSMAAPFVSGVAGLI